MVPRPVMPVRYDVVVCHMALACMQWICSVSCHLFMSRDQQSIDQLTFVRHQALQVIGSLVVWLSRQNVSLSLIHSSCVPAPDKLSDIISSLCDTMPTEIRHSHAHTTGDHLLSAVSQDCIHSLQVTDAAQLYQAWSAFLKSSS